jgi:enamine deaminase RidA (YjgF/YER057c/UK114 family)
MHMTPDEVFDSISLKVTYPLEITLKPLAGLENNYYVSGQVAMRNGGLVATGLVGAQVSLEVAQECGRQCAINILSSVKSQLGTLSSIKQVTRIAVYVASADGFTDQHLVAHGASQLFIEVFGPEIGSHARTAIGVKSLPLSSPVEVDAIFQL